jgi:hypothetical protein
VWFLSLSNERNIKNGGKKNVTKEKNKRKEKEVASPF